MLMIMINGEQKMGIIINHDRRKAERVSYFTGKCHTCRYSSKRGMCLAKIDIRAKLK